MPRQPPSTDRPESATRVDPALLDAAAEVIAAHGYEGLTLARLSDAVGLSRMTLHRRGVTIAEVVEGLSLHAADEVQQALFPILTGTGCAANRLEEAVIALFEVADRNLALLAGLFAADEGIFHAEPDETGALPTDEVFIAPLAKLLAEGAGDDSLVASDDPRETATVLFNLAGWGYVQLRHSQRWPAERARRGVLALVFGGLLPASS